jgi:dodecin
VLSSGHEQSGLSGKRRRAGQDRHAIGTMMFLASRYRLREALFESTTPTKTRGDDMAKKNEDGIYKIVEVVGTSKKSWEDAASNAVATAAKTLRDLRIAEITKLDMKVEDGKVIAYRARVSLSFKYDK